VGSTEWLYTGRSLRIDNTYDCKIENVKEKDLVSITRTCRYDVLTDSLLQHFYRL
jgi:hypothetical protein